MPSSGRGWMIINVHPNLDGKYQHALTSLVVDLPQWWLMVVNGGQWLADYYPTYDIWNQINV